MDARYYQLKYHQYTRIHPAVCCNRRVPTSVLRLPLEAPAKVNLFWQVMSFICCWTRYKWRGVTWALQVKQIWCDTTYSDRCNERWHLLYIINQCQKTWTDRTVMHFWQMCEQYRIILNHHFTGNIRPACSCTQITGGSEQQRHRWHASVGTQYWKVVNEPPPVTFRCEIFATIGIHRLNKYCQNLLMFTAWNDKVKQFVHTTATDTSATFHFQLTKPTPTD